MFGTVRSNNKLYTKARINPIVRPKPQVKVHLYYVGVNTIHHEIDLNLFKKSLLNVHLDVKMFKI